MASPTVARFRRRSALFLDGTRNGDLDLIHLSNDCPNLGDGIYRASDATLNSIHSYRNILVARAVLSQAP